MRFFEPQLGGGPDESDGDSRKGIAWQPATQFLGMSTGRIQTVSLRGFTPRRALEERGRECILPIAVAAAELPGMQPTTGYLNFSDYPMRAYCRNLEAKTEQLRPILLGILNFGLALLGVFGLPLLQFNRGAWTDALVVGPPVQDWIRIASCPFPVH